MVISGPTLLSDSADNFCALAGDNSFLNHLVFLYLVGVGFEMELFNERELWQRSFSLSNIWSVTPNVHIDVDMVDCVPIFGKFVQNFFKLIGVVGDEDFGDLDRSLRRLLNVFGVSNSSAACCGCCGH